MTAFMIATTASHDGPASMAARNTSSLPTNLSAASLPRRERRRYPVMTNEPRPSRPGAMCQYDRVREHEEPGGQREQHEEQRDGAHRSRGVAICSWALLKAKAIFRSRGTGTGRTLARAPGRPSLNAGRPARRPDRPRGGRRHVPGGRRGTRTDGARGEGAPHGNPSGGPGRRQRDAAHDHHRHAHPGPGVVDAQGVVRDDDRPGQAQHHRQRRDVPAPSSSQGVQAQRAHGVQSHRRPGASPNPQRPRIDGSRVTRGGLGQHGEEPETRPDAPLEPQPGSRAALAQRAFADHVRIARELADD